MAKVRLAQDGNAQQDHPEKVGFDAGKLEGLAERAMPAMGPLWERNKAGWCSKAFNQVTAKKAFHRRGGLVLLASPGS